MAKVVQLSAGLNVVVYELRIARCKFTAAAVHKALEQRVTAARSLQDWAVVSCATAEGIVALRVVGQRSTPVTRSDNVWLAFARMCRLIFDELHLARRQWTPQPPGTARAPEAGAAVWADVHLSDQGFEAGVSKMISLAKQEVDKRSRVLISGPYLPLPENA